MISPRMLAAVSIEPTVIPETTSGTRAVATGGAGLRAGLEHQLAFGVEDALAHLAFVGLGHLDELAQAVRLVLPKLLVGVDVLGQPIGLEIGREGKLMVELA